LRHDFPLAVAGQNATMLFRVILVEILRRAAFHLPVELAPRTRRIPAPGQSSTPRSAPGRGPLPRFLLLYVLIYAAYGIEGPFMPALLADRGMSAEMIGLLLAAGTGARLLTAPLAASLGDRLGAPRAVLAASLLLSAVLGCGLLLAEGLAGLLLVSVLVAMALAPVNPLADAMACAAAAGGGGGPSGRGGDGGKEPGFSYGVVRGTGSAAFVGAAMVAGPVVATAGTEATVWAGATLLALGAVAVLGLPRGRRDAPSRARPARRSGGILSGAAPGALRQLLAMPLFRGLLLVTGLVQGSHAFYGAFATLHWQAAGISPEAIGLLWSVAVASEVLVFLFVGPWLLGRLGPGGLAALSAGAGVLRWTVMAGTDALAVQFLLQPLHGLTFAALHLATMRLLGEAVPPHLSATAFGVQSSLGPGLAGAVLTLAAGPLYAGLGAGGFCAMAVLCGLALPAALGLGARAETAAATGAVPVGVASLVPAPALAEAELRPALTSH
jgi:PPP family 3-phenylpropionic acid transporter